MSTRVTMEETGCYNADAHDVLQKTEKLLEPVMKRCIKLGYGAFDIEDIMTTAVKNSYLRVLI